MAVFVPVIATIKAAYDTFVSSKATTVAAQTTVNGLGNRPTYPTEVDVATDWTSVTTSQNTYDINLATAKGNLATAQTTQRTNELAVIVAMGYNSGAIPPAGGGSNGILSDEWVKLIGAGGGVLTYTHWIGWSVNSLYLTILTQQPLNSYPDKTPA